MKKLILDTPFRDSFSDFLDKGETILWQENPRLNISYFNHILKEPIEQLLIAIVIVLFLTFYLMEFIGPLGGIIIFLTYVIIEHFWVNFRNIKNKKTLYAITQKRIFFSFKTLNKATIHSINFIDIKNFQINHDKYDKKSNTVFLSLKNPTSISFTTYNLKNGEGRHQPTLELIKDAKTVSNLLLNGIKNANTSL